MKDISLKEYDDSMAQEWDQFITNSSRNGGIFHERRFLSYHNEGKYNDASLAFYKNKELLGVFPAAVTEINNVKKVISHPGSSNGGLVYENTANLDTVLSMLELLIEHYKNIGIKEIEMKIAEPIFNKLPDAELIYLLWHRGFHMSTQEISTCVKLSDHKSWEKMCRKRQLYYIRRLEKEGVVANSSGDIEKVYRVIEKNLGDKYNKKPTHSLEELKKLKELYPDRIHFWAAEKGDILLGVIVVFVVNNNGVHDFYISRNDEVNETNALSFLHHKAFDFYAEKGITWFNFGISSRGEEIKWGILRSKERIGGRATTRQVWKMDDLQSYKKYEFEPAYDLSLQKSSGE